MDFISNMIKNFIKKLRKINLLSLKLLMLFIFLYKLLLWEGNK